MSLDAPAPVPDPVPAPATGPAHDPVAVDSAVVPPFEVPAGGKDVLAPLAEVPAVPPRPRRSPLRWLLIAGAGVVAVVLVAGLIVWHPWNPPPGSPAALHGTSPTATSVRLAWPASTGGNVAHYLVLRDGKQVGEIPASQTSWTGQGLTPGVAHKYTVRAQGSGGTSGPSVAVTVTTLTPARSASGSSRRAGYRPRWPGIRRHLARCRAAT